MGANEPHPGGCGLLQAPPLPPKNPGSRPQCHDPPKKLAFPATYDALQGSVLLPHSPGTLPGASWLLPPEDASGVWELLSSNSRLNMHRRQEIL